MSYVAPQKINLLESSIEFLKEKAKFLQTTRTNIENRLLSLQTRMMNVVNTAPKFQKENFTGLDSQLINSQVFASSLKKVDANATANMRRMEEYFGELIQQSTVKFSEIEQKLLGMMVQKQKILRNMSFQLDNNRHAIAAIQQWVNTEHGTNNYASIMEQHLRNKLEAVQKNNEIKMEILQEKIKYFEQFKESVLTHRKNTNEEKEEIKDQFKQLKIEMQKQIEEVKKKLQKYSKNNLVQKNQESGLSDSQKLIKKINRLDLRIDQVESVTQKLKNQMKLLQSRLDDGEHNSRQRLPIQKKKQISQSNSNFYTQQVEPRQVFKKPLPPKKPALLSNQQSSYNQSNPSSDYESSISDMRGGIRGLLNKSKQKQKHQMRPNNFMGNRQMSPSKKGLPPVKEDPLARKKKGQTQNKGRKQKQQEDAVVYQIDEEGYLMDEEGNYLLNEEGQMIKLSQEEIEQYMQDDQDI